jgi:hypothetical protein
LIVKDPPSHRKHHACVPPHQNGERGMVAGLYSQHEFIVGEIGRYSCLSPVGCTCGPRR